MTGWLWMWAGIVTRIAAHAAGRHAPACSGRYCTSGSGDLNAR